MIVKYINNVRLTRLSAVVTAKTGRAVALAVVLAAICKVQAFEPGKHAIETRRTILVAAAAVAERCQCRVVGSSRCIVDRIALSLSTVEQRQEKQRAQSLTPHLET